jgi:hypothetical protein
MTRSLGSGPLPLFEGCLGFLQMAGKDAAANGAQIDSRIVADHLFTTIRAALQNSVNDSDRLQHIP